MQKIFLVLTVAIMMICGTSFSEAADKEPPLLSVSGTGSVETTPDEATVSIGVSTSARDAAQAQNENAARAAAVQNAIKNLGIDGKSIRTRNYSFRPTYSHNEKRENIITGYAVDNTVEVKINNIGMVGKVIDAALSAGANRVNSLSFAAKNTEYLKREALLKAVNDAKFKADVIAKGLGRRIVSVWRVSENVGTITSRNYGMNMMTAKMTAFDAAETPIETPELTLDATVHIDFAIE